VTELADYYRDRAGEYDASDDGDTFQWRTLNDGRGFEILKNFPSRDQLLAYFWLAVFSVR
jgi:hypothetical protein